MNGTRKGPPTLWHQGNVGAHFPPSLHASRLTPHASRLTPHRRHAAAVLAGLARELKTFSAVVSAA